MSLLFGSLVPFRGSIRRPVELTALLLLVLTLPNLEAPKNLAWLGWVATWVYNRWRSRDFGGPWRAWDSVFALWLASPLLVHFGAAFPSSLRESADVFRYVLLGWLLMRSGYGTAEWRALGTATAISLILGISWALWDWTRPHSYEGIQLASVGHVNHSAIYLVIAFGALTGGACALWGALRPAARALLAGTVSLIVVALLLAGSRAAAGFMLILALFIGLVWWRRSRWPLLVMTGVAVLSLALLYGFDQDMRRKFAVADQSDTGMLYARAEIWRQAFEAARAHPWFGVGMENFKKIDPPTVQRWVESRGGEYLPERYRGNPHAHNLYLNLLAERGIIGTALSLLPLLGAALLLARTRPLANQSPEEWGMWMGAASGVGATLAVGVFNSTLHHEHAMLTTLLLGLWLNSHRSGMAKTLEAAGGGRGVGDGEGN